MSVVFIFHVSQITSSYERCFLTMLNKWKCLAKARSLACKRSLSIITMNPSHHCLLQFLFWKSRNRQLHRKIIHLVNGIQKGCFKDSIGRQGESLRGQAIQEEAKALPSKTYPFFLIFHKHLLQRYFLASLPVFGLEHFPIEKRWMSCDINIFYTCKVKLYPETSVYKYLTSVMSKI